MNIYLLIKNLFISLPQSSFKKIIIISHQIIKNIHNVAIRLTKVIFKSGERFISNLFALWSRSVRTIVKKLHFTETLTVSTMLFVKRKRRSDARTVNVELYIMLSTFTGRFFQGENSWDGMTNISSCYKMFSNFSYYIQGIKSVL